MNFETPLKKATLIKRYKRFLADVILADGTETTIHVANTGAMTGCAEPGDFVWYSTSSNPKRKYPFSWEMTETIRGDTICVNTIRANQLSHEAINAGVITELTGYKEVTSEVKYGSENSRIDFLLTDPARNNCFVEVKSVTLEQDNGAGYFPDAVSLRGQKHLRELMEVVAQGNRAVLLFVVLHSGINSVSAADFIDPKYAQLLQQAIDNGVEVIAYKATISPKKLLINEPLSFLLPKGVEIE